MPTSRGLIKSPVRVAVAALVAAVVVAELAIPAVNLRIGAHVPGLAPIIHRSAGYVPDPDFPTFHTPVPIRLFEAAAPNLPHGARYGIVANADAISYTDAVSAGRIWIPWALPVLDLRLAEWLIVISPARVHRYARPPLRVLHLPGGILVELRR